ncbi:MAG: UDP-N-acetylmuramate dehydrogenase [Phycisphaerales bacterium]|nr:UDP-N-acetylmuramate dehydrogenase [Phycisphaerales bacterium]
MMDSARSSLVGGLDLKIEFDAPIGARTWFGIGGRTEMLIKPETEDSLATLLRRCHQSGTPVRVLGGGANLLVDDAGVDGIVLQLDHETFTRRRYNKDGEVDRMLAMAGADLFKMVNESARQGLDGISQLAGIPGTLGGALRMNAGGSFGDIGQAVESVSMLDMEGNRLELETEQLKFDYRKSNLPNGIILSAILHLQPDDPMAVRGRVREIFAQKSASQPMADSSAGCAFRNPSVEGTRLPAGRLIDEAGLKGLSVGGATVSDRHANFISTTPQATARDVMKLMKQVQQRVLEHCGTTIQPEVVIWCDDPGAPMP